MGHWCLQFKLCILSIIMKRIKAVWGQRRGGGRWCPTDSIGPHEISGIRDWAQAVILLGTSCFNIQIVICHPTPRWVCFSWLPITIILRENQHLNTPCHKKQQLLGFKIKSVFLDLQQKCDVTSGSVQINRLFNEILSQTQQTKPIREKLITTFYPLFCLKASPSSYTKSVSMF